MKKEINAGIIAMFVFLAGCGGGGSSNNAAPDVRTVTEENAETSQTSNTEQTETISDDGNEISAEIRPATLPDEGVQVPESARDRATTATQKLGSITQSSNVDGSGITTDSIGVMLDDNGDPMFDKNGNIVVDNPHTGGYTNSATANDASCTINGFIVSCSFRSDTARIQGTPVIDAEGLTLKSPSEYESGDYYLVTGLWYEDENNFGVFADGPELTAALPTSGSATYQGGANGVLWDRGGTLSGAQRFSADVAFTAEATNGDVQISGRADNIMHHNYDNNALDPIFEGQAIVFQKTAYTAPGITGGAVGCAPNCSVVGGSWGGQFHGDPPSRPGGNGETLSETDGWPFSFNGTFGIQGLTYDGNLYDALGRFSTIHGGLEQFTGLHTCLTESGFFHGIPGNGESCFN